MNDQPQRNQPHVYTWPTVFDVGRNELRCVFAK